MFRRILKEQRGAFMVFFAILVPLFIGMIGFAVDAGFIYMQKAKMQDIADAAALAGAARLNDGEDKEGHVTSAVRAYAEANGLSGVATAMASLDESSDLPTKYDKLKILQGIQYNVTDKDGKQRDHVKVVIAKRVPTFFINVLFQKDGVVVKVAAAAEYVEGEEAPSFDRGDAVIMAGQIDFKYQSKDNILLGSNKSFPVYVGSPVDIAKLPGTGYIYANNLTLNGTTIQGVGFDEKKQQPIWNPPMPDRIYIPTGGYAPYWGPESYRNAVKEESDRMNAKFTALKNEARSESNSKKSIINDYIEGKDNKRFIGYANGKCMDNIKPSDTEIELYMSGTYAEQFGSKWGERSKEMSILTNRQLLNVKKVAHLVTDKSCVIATEGITYGKILTVDTSEWYGPDVTISGSKNTFNNTIHAGGQIWLGGYNNRVMSSNVAFLCNQTLHFGLWQSYSERVVPTYTHHDPITDKDVFVDGIDFDQETWIDASNDSSWRIDFGGSSGGSSGSDDSGDDVKAHVRLVE